MVNLLTRNASCFQQSTYSDGSPYSGGWRDRALGDLNIEARNCVRAIEGAIGDPDPEHTELWLNAAQRFLRSVMARARVLDLL